jgi:hypothetical protein
MAPDTRQKALDINLDSSRYGSFAEIGAGQEVVRWFFRVGGAAGTVAKSMSAYDMKVSDEIYGHADRYVSRARLVAMLDHEHTLNLERLTQRAAGTSFFAFADTVAARSFRGAGECHAWMGIRFQVAPRTPDSQIVLHVRMLDAENLQQQEALGTVGVNLIHGAFHLFEDPRRLIASLLDDLSTDRIQIDLIDFSGHAFEGVENRLMSLELVRRGLTSVAMFGPNGETLHASDVLYGHPVLVQRGRFRPPTLVNLDMQACARAQFGAEPGIADEEIVSLLEMTLPDLTVGSEIDTTDFLDRIHALEGAGFTVLISNEVRYFRLAEYLSRHTRRPIGIVLGIRNVRDIFDPRHYDGLAGGMLEAAGRLFKEQVRLFVHPALEGGRLVTADALDLGTGEQVLYRYLLEQGRIRPMQGFEERHLPIVSDDVLELIRSGDASWLAMVPPAVADAIRNRKLLGYSGDRRPGGAAGRIAES